MGSGVADENQVTLNWQTRHFQISTTSQQKSAEEFG